jgi:plastocyanin
MRRRRWIRGGAAVALALGVAGPALSDGGAAASAAIRVFQFQPGALEVRAGTQVTWTNQDDITHTVTSGVPGSPDGRFDLRLTGKGVSGNTIFTVPGVYPYFCSRHQSMQGEVVVR